MHVVTVLLITALAHWHEVSIVEQLERPMPSTRQESFGQAKVGQLFLVTFIKEAPQQLEEKKVGGGGK